MFFFTDNLAPAHACQISGGERTVESGFHVASLHPENRPGSGVFSLHASNGVLMGLGNAQPKGNRN